MTRIAAHRTLLTGAALALAGALIAGCTAQGSSSPPSGPASARDTSPASAPQSPTEPAGAGATTPAGSAPTAPGTSTGHPTATAPAPTTTFTRVPMQSAFGGEFFSPSGNISCEVDYHRAAVPDAAYCETLTPSRSVTMTVTGTYTTCTGQQCQSNAGEGTPTLAYGTETGVGPFLCQSATTGVTCTTGGKGFLISAAGITPVG
jgi:hypothetical protein